MPVVNAATVAANAVQVRDRIAAAGGDPGRVRLVAMTKGFDVDAVRAAIDAGFVDIGENRAQELLSKAGELGLLARSEGRSGLLARSDGRSGPLFRSGPASAVRWHFLGAIQRNKVGSLAPLVALWQTVDRREEGRSIADHAPGAPVLVEVNATGEAQKDGCPPTAVPSLVEELRASGLDVRGLMTMGKEGDTRATRSAFALVADLAAACGLDELSMGMTDDLEAAVEAGTTMVRVGRALFGPRPRGGGARR